jgi:large subunit ribosomal protein L17
MKKNVFGRQFKRDANERKALFKNLLTSLVMQERIQTTEAKAKAIKAAADKLVTRAKKGDGAERFLAPRVNHDAVVKLMKDIAPRFVNREGGYTRIIKTKNRIADNAPQVFMEWTEIPALVMAEPKAKKNADAKSKRSASGGKPSARSQKATTVEATAPTAKEIPGAKKEQAAKPGIFKRLVTRQKKG